MRKHGRKQTSWPSWVKGEFVKERGNDKSVLHALSDFCDTAISSSNQLTVIERAHNDYEQSRAKRRTTVTNRGHRASLAQAAYEHTLARAIKSRMAHAPCFQLHCKFKRKLLNNSMII